MRKILTITLLLALALSLTACGDGKKDDTDDPQPVTKTYLITFKDGALVFTVEYKAYPTDAEPAYLMYLQTRLGVIVNGEGTNAEATDHLIDKGSNHRITVEYTNTVYEGIKWNATSRTFTIHNDWITTATDTDLSGAMLRNAFNAVE